MKKLVPAIFAFATLLAASNASHAVGQLADVNVIDRQTGRALPVTWHDGTYYVAGTPGTRYAISVRNQSGARVLAVMSVDGVNIVSGETAGFGQTGYVFDGWEASQIAGWRKSDSRIAAFNFTALSNSYAARTGRPDQVGVIGVALFREQAPIAVAPPLPPPCRWWRGCGRDLDSAEQSGAARDRASGAAKSQSAPAPSAAASAESAKEAAPQRREAERLGTGHGASETSVIARTQFERASSTPDEVITIQYDSRDNLIARGILPAEAVAAVRPRPTPFPGSEAGYVPDPPRRW